jgi:hypothetical protein
MSDALEWLPQEIPDYLRRHARPLHGPDEGLVLWSRDAAKAVLQSLSGTKVAIRGGGVYYSTTEDPAPFDGWAAAPLWGEQGTAFAERSRALAEAKVREHQGSPTNPVFFAFDFAAEDVSNRDDR